MNKNKITLFLLCMLALGVLLSLFSPLARAEWEKLSETGSWAICERNRWKETLESTVGFAEWGNKSIENFVGYYGVVAVTQLETGATGWGWWENVAVTQLSFWLNFTGVGGKEIILNLDFKNRRDLWGLIGGISVQSRVCEDWGAYMGTDAGTLYYQTDTLSFRGYTEIFAYMDGTNLTVAVYNYQNMAENPRLMSVASFAVGGDWFGNVSINMAVRHQGFHPFKFDAYLLYENFEYSVGELPTEKGYGENILDTFVNGMLNLFDFVPQWIRDVVASCYTYVKWLLPIANLLVGALSALLPFLPVIFIFYGLDVCITSVATGSFEPIGVMVTTMYGLASSFISAVVAVIGTIYDFIKFW